MKKFFRSFLSTPMGTDQAKPSNGTVPLRVVFINQSERGVAQLSGQHVCLSGKLDPCILWQPECFFSHFKSNDKLTIYVQLEF